MATKPTISPLPTPPNMLSGSATFAADADAFLSALPPFGGQTNAVATFIDGRAAAAEQFASSAQTAASTASGHAVAASASASTAQDYAQQTASDRLAVETAVAEGPVILINGQSGIVELDAEDVGAAMVDMSNVDQQDVRDAAGIGTNAVGNRTVSTSAPSGVGAPGDIWYRIE